MQSSDLKSTRFTVYHLSEIFTDATWLHKTLSSYMKSIFTTFQPSELLNLRIKLPFWQRKIIFIAVLQWSWYCKCSSALRVWTNYTTMNVFLLTQTWSNVLYFKYLWRPSMYIHVHYNGISLAFTSAEYFHYFMYTTHKIEHKKNVICYSKLFHRIPTFVT